MSEEFYQPLSSLDRSILQQEEAQQEAFFIDDSLFLEKLLKGDEEAFISLVSRYHAPMLRLVMIYSPNRFLAEEVVQEAWLGVLQSLKNFEGRSSLKTWIFRILTNRMKTRLQREGRSVPFSSFSDKDEESSEVEGETRIGSSHSGLPWFPLAASVRFTIKSLHLGFILCLDRKQLVFGVY
jgi:hypothetical protein